MNRKVAEQIKAIALDCARRLDESVAMVQEQAPEALQEYRRAVGRVFGEIDDRILRPIYDEHYDLAPDWYKEMVEAAAKRKSGSAKE